MLFTRAYEPVDALDRLWRAASWRVPWRDAPAVVLPEEAAASPRSVAIVAEKHGLPELAGMPPEIQRMVRDYSASALFWRLTAALDLAARFESGPTVDLVSLPLRDVVSWERGSDPARSEDLLHHLPIIRLTIDSRGLRKLERLQDKPRFSHRRFDNMVFIVAGEECFDGIVALFKVTRSSYHPAPSPSRAILANDEEDGQARLELPEGHPGFQIWDLPNPPPQPLSNPLVSGFSLCGTISASARLCTIDMATITGLTFFFNQCDLLAIHAHTPTAPYAAMPPASFSWRVQAFATWVYVPIPANDRVLAVGVRGLDAASFMHPPCILVCLRPVAAYRRSALSLTLHIRSALNSLASSPLGHGSQDPAMSTCSATPRRR